MAWVPGSRSKFEIWTSVPSLHSWNIAECDIKPQTNKQTNLVTLTLTLKLKIAFSTLLPPGAYCSVSQSTLDFYTPVFIRVVLLYGDVRPGLRPFDSPSVQVSVRPFFALFSYLLWYIELKFCTWLCSNVLRIKLVCRHFASILRSYASLWTQNIAIGNVQFSALFSYMLWHIELKLCIWNLF